MLTVGYFIYGQVLFFISLYFAKVKGPLGKPGSLVVSC